MNKRFEKLKGISDIVDTMIRGLKKEWVKVDMKSFGTVVDDVCFGCAATNTLCELMQEQFTNTQISSPLTRYSKFNGGITEDELVSFEGAIDHLRLGNIQSFLNRLIDVGHLFNFEIPEYYETAPDTDLPVLRTDDWKENLHFYEEYRDFLITEGL